MLYFDLSRLYAPHMCIILLYVYNIASIGIPFAFVAFTVHRFCSIIYYTKAFFKTKRWVMICIACQWIGECLISLPFLFRNGSVCSNEPWMRMYTFIMAVFVPLFINAVLNVLIFSYVRNSVRRIQPHLVSIATRGNTNQQSRISRREIWLLKEMIFMFVTFLIGWFPVYFIVIIMQYFYIHPLIFRYSVVLGELILLAILMNLFMCNHEVRQYLINKIRQCV